MRDHWGPTAALQRGAIGDEIDGRSREGKFLRRIESELVAQLGGSPSFTQRLLIRRAGRLMLQAETLDTKMASGNWTAHDGRIFSALNNGIRLCLRELNMKPKASEPAPAPSLAEIAARHAKAAGSPS